jgi:hypothetical protein
VVDQRCGRVFWIVEEIYLFASCTALESEFAGENTLNTFTWDLNPPLNTTPRPIADQKIQLTRELNGPLFFILIAIHTRNESDNTLVQKQTFVLLIGRITIYSIRVARSAAVGLLQS